MNHEFMIGNRKIGRNHPVYIVAEMSANHHQDFEEAVKIIHAAKEVGADAVKLQTYTPDTITIDCDNEYFQIGRGTIWEGQTLYNLYKQAYTPWEWQPRLKEIANGIGLELFSSPFDHTAVDFLEEMDVRAYKVASPELVDIPLIQRVARTGRPILMSTGMAVLSEIDEAVRAAKEAGCKDLALLKCTSVYPAPPEEMNLRTIPHMAKAFRLPVGLSDHTMGIAVPVAATSLGACVIEKHITLSRSIPGPDSAFSLEPGDFRAMVEAIRTTEKALGSVSYELTEREISSRSFRRSIFAVKDIRKGEVFTKEKIRSIRPAQGLPPALISNIIGRVAVKEISRGTPISWDSFIE
jgi:pseudaminic acid synthase